MHDIHVPSQIRAGYLERTRGTTLLLLAMIAVGAVSFFVLLGTDPDRAWQAYVSNWLFFTSIAMGAVMVGAATTITKAKWNWSIRRIAVAFGAFLPLSFLLLLPMLSLRESFFPWIEKMEYDHIVQLKEAYLNIPFLMARNVVAALVLFGMGLAFVYWAVRPDLGPERARDEEGDKGRARWRERLSGDWLGQEEETARSWGKLKVLAPALALVFAMMMSVFAVDWVMTLEPHWFSTLLPGWFFMGAFWGGLCAVAVLMWILKRRDSYWDEVMGPQQMHDLGKLIFGFAIFWAYLFFSQYIVMWYGKLPWEQEWFIHRAGAEWGPLSVIVIVMCFVIPFAALIGQKPKVIPGWLAGVSLVALVGLWLERFILVAPSLHVEGTATLTFWEPLIGLGFLGLFAWSVRWFLATFPVVQIWQPPVDPEMVEMEVKREEAPAA
jgi:hypothetical protein